MTGNISPRRLLASSAARERPARETSGWALLFFFFVSPSCSPWMLLLGAVSRGRNLPPSLLSFLFSVRARAFLRACVQPLRAVSARFSISLRRSSLAALIKGRSSASPRSAGKQAPLQDVAAAFGTP
ncbi:hypothetical protein HPB50_021434 [Hyalomma asiaticum]|uniref:Uncharacterized protein n=1 Tax=Hyalomma asiaticum TaxID=266040 RepID=A0ACB7TP41_HYAAI|nr:hypothetical protein HPB50_021434 [Hyalomma asiaticum]